MYRYHQHLMNDENWNRDLKKPSRLEADGPHEKVLHEISANSKTINPPVDTVSKARNPVAADYHPKNVMPETTPPVTKKDTHITSEQDEEKKMHELKTVNKDITQQMRWPVSKGAKKRKKGNHTWMFVLTGLIISVVSGFLMYTWIARSDKNEFVSSLESFSIQTAEASDQDEFVYDNKEDTDFIADEIMDQEDNPEYLNEEVLNEPDMADLEDDMDVMVETSTASGSKAASDSWNGIDLTPVKENPVMDMKKPLEYANEIADDADEIKIVMNEKLQGSADQKSEVTNTTSGDRAAPDLPLKKEKKEKIEQLAQLLASSDIAVHNMQIDLTDDVQSGKDNNVGKDRSYNGTVNDASDQGDMIPVTKKIPGKVDTHQVSLSKKQLEHEQKENAVNDHHMDNPVHKGKNVSALDSGRQPLKTEMPARQVSDQEHHKPVKAILLANALPERKSVSLLNSLDGNPAGKTHKNEKKSINATPAITKEIIQKEGQRYSGPVLLAGNKKSAPDTSAPNYQPVKTVALKEMSVTYEDQFNDHTNHWPEYNNDRASVLIEEGEYHVENKAKSGSHIVLHPYGVSNDMNYMIHIAISSVRGPGKNAYGFVFGGKDIHNNYSFQIHGDDSYSIKKRLGGNEEELAGGHIENVFISRNSGKTLKIVKLQNRVRFYVDDYYLDELKNVEFTGDKVGFLVEGKVKISVDSTRTEIKFNSN